MKQVISAVAFGFIIVALVSSIAVAQPASRPSGGSAQQLPVPAAARVSMMGCGAGMGMGMGGMGGMGGMMGMRPMMMQTIQQDPELKGRMMRTSVVR